MSNLDEYIALDIQKWYNASKEELEYVSTLSEDEQIEYWTRQEQIEINEDDENYDEIDFNIFKNQNIPDIFNEDEINEDDEENLLPLSFEWDN